jgi:hypothetical protein
MRDYNKNHIYKINKYKLKFLYSLIDKKSFNSSIYLKKYCYHTSLNNFLVGGTNISINSRNELDEFLSNITKLFNTIFGEKITTNIMGEFRKKTNFDNIKYPEYLNLDNLIKNIFKAIYSNQETNKLDENMSKQINKIIDETINQIKTTEPIKTTKPEKKEKKKEEMKEEKKEEIKENLNMLFNPIFIQPQTLYLNPYNYYNNDIGFNVSISDSTTTTTDDPAKLVNKYLKNKLKNNIVIY